MKTTEVPGVRGYDAGKKVKGRKRHLLVDTLGLLLLVVVHSAGIQDRDGAKLLLEKARGLFPRLRLLWADGGYAGKLIDWVKMLGGWMLEIVKRSDQAKGFVLLAQTLDRGTDLRLVGPVSAAEQRLRSLARNQRSNDLYGHDPFDGPSFSAASRHTVCHSLKLIASRTGSYP